MRHRVTLAAVSFAAGLTASANGQSSCESLTALALANATIVTATQVPAGTFTPPPGTVPAASFPLPGHCKVEGIARPTSDSEIRFQVWLPIGAAWNGRFQQMGNGGYAGSINSAVMALGVADGYATAATDNGHVGPTPDFAIGHPEKVVDFGHRAVHLTAEHGKAVIAAFYGKPASRAYFFGCSDGGREALMEAQKYPGDFDGIVVGAPANFWNGLLAGAVWNWRALNETPSSMIPITKLAAIQAAVVKACDRLDGVTDGLLNDPRRCRFEPATLTCAGADNDSCLTGPQVAALRKIYQGPSIGGRQIYPGMVPGTEAYPGNWNPWIVGKSPMGLPLQAWFGTTFYSAMVYEDPKWDVGSFDLERDFAKALAKTGNIIDSNDPNLAPFRDRGGKLIQYHGWGDAAINGTSSIEYYERVAKTLGKPVDDFYRLFMVPGMGHCAGGAGPNSFGNTLSTAGRGDPERDIRAALVRWVEQDVAPERLIATGIRSGDPVGDPAKETALTRPLCAYPTVPTYQGSGSPDDAANFACRPPGA